MSKITEKTIHRAILELQDKNSTCSLESIKEHVGKLVGKEVKYDSNFNWQITNMLLRNEIKKESDGKFKSIIGTEEQLSCNRRRSSRLKNQTQNNDTGNRAIGTMSHVSDSIIEKFITNKPNWKVNSENAVSDIVYLLPNSNNDGTDVSEKKGIGVKVKMSCPNRSISREGVFNKYKFNFGTARKNTPKPHKLKA